MSVSLVRRALLVESAWVFCGGQDGDSEVPLAVLLEQFSPEGYYSVVTQDLTAENARSNLIAALDATDAAPDTPISRSRFHLAWLRMGATVDVDDLFEYSILNCYLPTEDSVTSAIQQFQAIDIETMQSDPSSPPHQVAYTHLPPSLHPSTAALPEMPPATPPGLPSYLRRHHPYNPSASSPTDSAASSSAATGAPPVGFKSVTGSRSSGTAAQPTRVGGWSEGPPIPPIARKADPDSDTIRVSRVRGYAGHMPRGAEMVGVRWAVHDQLHKSSKKVYYQDGLESFASIRARIAAAEAAPKPPQPPVVKMRIEKSLRSVPGARSAYAPNRVM